MVSVRATYDGKQLQLLEDVDIKTPQEVIVVFLHLDQTSTEDIHGAEIARLVQNGGALDFLNDAAEDIYDDEDLKVRY